jgi:predicted nucleic acid-binding protein
VKLFVDANTLVSALVFAGIERLLVQLGRFGVCDLTTNEYVREEVQEVLARPHLHLSEEEQRRLIAWLDLTVRTVPDPSARAIRAARGRVGDAEDLPVLVGFEASGCDYLVTGDRKLRDATPRAITTRRAIRMLLGEFE